MSNIIVCGSEGSLMQAVIPLLLQQGHRVVGIDNLSRHGEPGNIKSEKYEWKNIDAAGSQVGDVFQFGFEVLDEHDAHVKFDDVDYIIQGAATIFGVGGFNAHCADILSKDLAIQANMLYHAKNATIYNSRSFKKFIYISSSMVYENCEQNKGNDESEPDFAPAPFTDYGLSKLVGERMVKAYHKQYGMPYLIWRPFNILTPKEISDHGQGYNHVFADFIDQLIGEKVDVLPIFGDGHQVRCFTWIDDVAKMISDNSLGNTLLSTYNIGTNRATTMIELAEMIHKIGVDFGIRENKPLLYKSIAPFKHDVTWRMPNIDRIKNEFNFKPSIELEDALKACVRYYIRRKFKW